MSASSPPVFIVDEHGDALHYWRQALPSGACANDLTAHDATFTVLHVDSHADMHVDWADDAWTKPSSSWQPPSLEELQARILSEVNISNFQPAAIFMGIISASVWLRSDFPLGKYNSPPPGYYRRLIGMPDYSKPNLRPDLGNLPDQLSDGGKRGQPLLCIWEHDLDQQESSFHKYGDFFLMNSGEKF